MTQQYRHYAESSEEQIDADRETLLNTLLQEARGYEHRLSAKELSERTGINDSTIRDAVIELRSEFSVPIGNVGSGYFVIETEQERERVLSTTMTRSRRNRIAASKSPPSGPTHHGRARTGARIPTRMSSSISGT